MKLQLKNNSLREALNVISKITGAEHANLIVQEQDIYLSATGNNKTVKWLVQGEIVDKPKVKGFGFNVFTLSNLIAGRSDFELELLKSTIHFSSKDKRSKLKGEFQSLPLEELEIAKDNAIKELSLSAKEMASLQEAIDKVSIANIFGTEALNLFVRIDNRGLRTVVYDIHHVAYLHSPNLKTKEELDFSIPLPLFQSISSLVKNADYTLSIGSNYIIVKGTGFEFSLPTMQGLGQQSFDQADGLIQNLTKGKDYFEINKSDLQNTIQNLGSIDDGGSSITVSSDKKKGLKFTLKSGYGTITEITKSKAKMSKDYVISPNLLADILRVYPVEELKISFNQGQMIIDKEIKDYRVTYVCVLK